jgi:hypothetical protein
VLILGWLIFIIAGTFGSSYILLGVIIWRIGRLVNDKINVSQNSGAKYNQYDGTTTLSSILKTDKGWVVFVPKVYMGASPENGGVIKG